jgi:hypothetical protein
MGGVIAIKRFTNDFIFGEIFNLSDISDIVVVEKIRSYYIH